MEGSRLLRLVRIAVTALCLTACVLLTALWLRSYWRFDLAIFRIGNSTLTVALCQGKTSSTIASVDRNFGGAKSLYISPGIWYTTTESWKMKILHDKPDGELGKRLQSATRPRARINRVEAWRLTFPIWLLVIASGATSIALVLGKSWRFSLRTLLIAATLVALGMGLIVLLN
jgi:hypothetical protein